MWNMDSYVGISSGSRTCVFRMGGGRTNKEAKKWQPVGSTASAPLAIRRVRFTSTAPTHWPPLHSPHKPHSNLGHVTNVNPPGPYRHTLFLLRVGLWYGRRAH